MKLISVLKPNTKYKFVRFRNNHFPWPYPKEIRTNSAGCFLDNRGMFCSGSLGIWKEVENDQPEFIWEE